MVVRVKREREWNTISIFSSVTFVVLDQFVSRGGGLLERQKHDNHVFWKTGKLPLTGFFFQSIFRSPVSNIYLMPLWQSLRRSLFNKEGDLFWAQMKLQLSQFACYFP